MIRHTVVFRLKHAPGSDAERDFLKATCELARIHGVQKFECLRQTSAKNPYTFGLSMEFNDAAAYAFYDQHPDHVAFVQGRWIPEVAEFMEIDYAPHSA
ncbi:Dabb family protein [Prosthecobacter sp.]|uniref:Dabb family protein n=1 Tax=Prosthecobacter sp. TaxID=1965333 RepID=UPI001D381755|nr:Dabb family protein [Prosthecobacter sp.]MCB1278072.1 Dabb family protein [Prosthecobacter sp.]